VIQPDLPPAVPLDQLAPLQRAVLEALWDGGPGTVYEVLDRLPEGRAVPYTSVLSALQKLEKAGWAAHALVTRDRGRQYVYAAARTRETARAGTVRRVLEGVFGGDAFQMAQHLLGSESLSADELAALRRLIDQRRRAAREGPDV
jgi:predicted transcriptional regulator